MKKVSVEECKNLIATHQVELIDVREPWEIDICGIGGKSIPMDKIPAIANQLDFNKSYVIVCKTGRRAEAVANLLEAEFGHPHIFILEGGITRWFAVNDPLFELY